MTFIDHLLYVLTYLFRYYCFIIIQAFFVLCFKKSSSSIFIQKRVKTISLNLNFKTVFYCTTNNLHLSSLGLLYVVFKREDAICVNFDCFFTKHIIIQQTFPSSMVSLDTIQSTLVS